MLIRGVQEKGIVADLFHDGTGKPRKAIVMLGGSEGGKTWSGFFVRKPVVQIVSSGYTVLSLAYFKAPGLQSTLEEVPLEYFEKSFAWLANQPEAISDEIALLGVSKGGEVALLLGSINPSIKAVVALSPSSVVWQGIPKIGFDKGYARKSSWSYQGQGLPCVPDGLLSWNMGTMIRTALFGELRKVYEQALHSRPEVEAATIPVEKIQGAILLMSGKRDQMWPATEMSERMMSRLDASGFAYQYQHIVYDSNHSGYIRKKETWREILNFLKAHYASV